MAEEILTGKLYVVGTPIGNLEDITLRAARVLREVDVVAAEDTRRSLGLLNHLETPKRLVSYHEHNKRGAGSLVLAMLQEGKQVALVTDAGMPCLSDPGWELVDEAMQAGIPVEVVPGPSASITALAASGLDGGRFVFEGFLPRSGRERRERLQELKTEYRAIVFFEAPHRLAKTLEDLAELWPERRVAICHDLTKRFERITRGTLADLAAEIAATEVKGEFVLVVEAMDKPETVADSAESAQELLSSLLREGMSKKDAAQIVAQQCGLPKKVAYKMAVAMDEED